MNKERRPGRPGAPLMALVLLLTLAAANPAWALEPVRVLIVHAYSQEYPWTKGQHEGFVSTLSESRRFRRPSRRSTWTANAWDWKRII